MILCMVIYEKLGRKQDIGRGGWAGAVIWRAGSVGGAIYTRASVACDWAGAVMRKPLTKRKFDLI